jgi:ergothioneine biosynthesis protein EgtB
MPSRESYPSRVGISRGHSGSARRARLEGSSIELNRADLLRRFAAIRERTRSIFDLVAAEAYRARPIPLRNPIVFYEGHLPAFNVNTLLKMGLGGEGVDPALERIFERGIDPEDAATAVPRGGVAEWPARAEVLRFAELADEAIRDALARAPLEREDRAVLRRGQAVFAMMEHELMHQETLLYMLHRLPHEQKRRPPSPAPEPSAPAPRPEAVQVPAGVAVLGAEIDRTPFGWDNEFPTLAVEVPAFEIDVYDVTNERFLEFVEAGGYGRESLWTREDWRWIQAAEIRHPSFWSRRNGEWYWRGLFEDFPLPAGWPVYVSHAEASAYARWLGKRLPTEAEFHRAAFGASSGEERTYPWGDEPPVGSRGNFGFTRWDPAGVGSFPAGRSAFGIHDLLGNGWEWTSTVFGPFPGFVPMASYPAYSADFFDGRHFVLKGGSSGTATELLRPSFRNWFRPHYPYVYAAFRCVTG